MVNRLSLGLYVVFSCVACEPHMPSPSQLVATPTQPSETEAPSHPPIPNFPATVTMRVTSGGRPVSGASVTGYHETAKTREPLSREPAFTDVDGRYEFSNVFPGTVYLIAYKESYLSPCMATSDVRGDTHLELELVTRTALRPLRRPAPTLTGVVYDERMRPVVAANVGGFWLEEMYEFFTMTDEQGRYLLCGLPDDFLRRGIVKASASSRQAWHDFHHDGRAANLADGEFVLDLYLSRYDLQ